MKITTVANASAAIVVKNTSNVILLFLAFLAHQRSFFASGSGRDNFFAAAARFVAVSPHTYRGDLKLP